MSIRVHLRQLAGESAVYGLAPIIQRVISVFLTPLYTRLFVPADYGALSILDSTVSLLAPFAVLALDSAAFRWFYDADSPEDQRRAVGTWFWAQLCLSMLLAGLALLVPSAVLADLLAHRQARALLVAALAGLPLAGFERVIIAQARMQRRPWRAFALTLISSVVTISGTLVLVYWMRIGIIGVFLATLVTRTLIAAITVAWIHDWIAPKLFRLSLLRSMLRYSLPLVPNSVFVWIIALSDRFFVAHYWSATEVGLYSIGVSIGSVLTLLTDGFADAWFAFAFSIKDKAEATATYAHALEAYLSVTCFVALGLALFAPEALRVLTPERYHSAENVVAPIAIGYAIVGSAKITQIGALLVRRTRILLAAYSAAAAANLVFNFALIPAFGRVGAAYATLLSQAVLPLFLLWKSQELYRIPYRSWLIVGIPLVTLGIALAVRSFTVELSLVTAVVAKAVVLLIFAGALLFISSAREEILTLVRPAFARDV